MLTVGYAGLTRRALSSRALGLQISPTGQLCIGLACLTCWSAMHWACMSHLLVSYALSEGSPDGAQKTVRGPGKQGRQV